MATTAQTKAWKANNPHKVKEQQMKYYQKNKDRLQQKVKNWKLNNPCKVARYRLAEKERYHDSHNPY